MVATSLKKKGGGGEEEKGSGSMPASEAAGSETSAGAGSPDGRRATPRSLSCVRVHVLTRVDGEQIERLKAEGHFFWIDLLAPSGPW